MTMELLVAINSIVVEYNLLVEVNNLYISSVLELLICKSDILF